MRPPDDNDSVTAHRQTLRYAAEIHDLYQVVRDQNRRLEVLNSASDALQRTLELPDVAEVGLDQLTTQYDCAGIVGFLLPESSECHLFVRLTASAKVSHLTDDIEPRRVAAIKRSVEDGRMRTRRLPVWVKNMVNGHFDSSPLPMELITGFSTESGNTSFICVSRDAWKAKDEYLRSFIDRLSIALKNAVHYEELKRKSNETDALLQSAQALSESLQINNILQVLSKLVCGQILDSEAVVAVYLDSHVGQIMAGGFIRHLDGSLGNLTDPSLASPSSCEQAPQGPGPIHDPATLRDQTGRSAFHTGDEVTEWKTRLSVNDQKGELVIITPARKPLNRSKRRLIQAITNQVRVTLNNALMFAQETSSSIELAQRQEQRSLQLLQMAHELKTPVTAMRPLLNILSTNAVDNDRLKQKEIIGILNRSVGRLEAVSNRYLSGLESSEVPERTVRLEVTDLWMLLEETAQLHGESFRQYSQTLRLSSQVDDPVLIADPLAIEEVFTNLFSNCHKYAGPGADISVSLIEKSNQTLEVTVSDNGFGIRTPKLRRIRNSIRLEEDLVDASENLGLQICARLIALHGGRILISSREGKGTTVGFTLPRG